MDRSELGSLDGTTLVNGVTSDVHDTTKRTRTDGDTDGGASVLAGSTTGKTLGTWMMLVMTRVCFRAGIHTVHSNSTNDMLTQVLLLKLVPSMIIQ